jgi:hypothetical protein
LDSHPDSRATPKISPIIGIRQLRPDEHELNMIDLLPFPCKLLDVKERTKS